MTTGLLDTSVFIARELGRRVDADRLPEASAVSAITIGELRLGVLKATDDESRSLRMDTLAYAERLDPLPIDGPVATAWALLRKRLRAGGQRMEINDSWIAATAIAYGWPVLTQDRGFPPDVEGLLVIMV